MSSATRGATTVKGQGSGSSRLPAHGRPRGRRDDSKSGNDGAGMLRWLLTYADMITLLLVFFVVLYAVSQVNNARYEVLMKALKQVLTGQQVVTQVGGTVPIPPPVVGKLPTASQVEQQTLQRLASEIKQAAAQQGISTDVAVTVATVGAQTVRRKPRPT